MIRKLLLILSIAFAVFAFGYPCMVLPYTNYTFTYTEKDVEISSTLKFQLNGRVKITGDSSVSSSGLVEQENYYYKISFKNRQVLISDTKDFGNAMKLDIDNIYSLRSGALSLVSSKGYINNVAKWTSIGVGVVALLLVITIPTKRRG